MNSYHLKIVAPSGICYDKDAVSATLRTICGDVTIMAGHIPYVTAISAGECRIIEKEGDEHRRAACIGGFVQVTNEEVVFATNTFEWAEDIDIERAIKAKEKALKMIDEGKTEMGKIRLKRAETRLMVAEKSGRKV